MIPESNNSTHQQLNIAININLLYKYNHLQMHYLWDSLIIFSVLLIKYISGPAEMFLLVIHVESVYRVFAVFKLHGGGHWSQLFRPCLNLVNVTTFYIINIKFN